MQWLSDLQHGPESKCILALLVSLKSPTSRDFLTSIFKIILVIICVLHFMDSTPPAPWPALFPQTLHPLPGSVI